MQEDDTRARVTQAIRIEQRTSRAEQKEGGHDVVRRKVALVEGKIVVGRECGLVAKRSVIITTTRASSTPEEEDFL